MEHSGRVIGIGEIGREIEGGGVGLEVIGEGSGIELRIGRKIFNHHVIGGKSVGDIFGECELQLSGSGLIFETGSGNGRWSDVAVNVRDGHRRFSAGGGRDDGFIAAGGGRGGAIVVTIGNPRAGNVIQ